MNCAIHANAEATGFCRNCGRALCPACTREVQGMLYCESCLAGMVSQPQAPPAPSASVPPRAEASPGLAFVLGLCFPGLGAVYNGQYEKALIHLVVFVAIILGLSSGAGAAASTALGILLAGFILYMAFDAHRVARARQASGAAGRPVSEPFAALDHGRIAGPVILILLGLLFLFDQFGWISFARVTQLWPVILIALGVWMLHRRFSGPPER
jgi:TM2 domain-containing membrane protein YozV